MALAVPVTLKTTEVGENERLDYAMSAMQGHRENMEDAHAIVLDLDAATGTSFFGVYDGHGGPAVSKYCARHLHIELRRHERFHDNLRIAIERTFLRMDEMTKDRSAGRELSGYGGNDNWKAYRKAMRRSLFLPFCQSAYPGPENDGCTACVVLIRGNQIIVGNAGDSRCVLSRNNLAIDLSNNFKPSLPAERQRIEAAGHLVTFSERGNVRRIDDGIAILRSLGDLLYKDNNNLGPQEQAITAFLEVRTEEINQDDQFLIIACDGIWDFLTSQQAVDFIRIYLNAHAIVLDLDAATGTSFFGVDDGHGGPTVSKYCARHLHIELRGHERFLDNLQTAIERTFLRMDEMMKDRRAGRELSWYGGNENWKAYRKAMRTSLFLPFCQKPAYPGPENDGCTACVVLIRGNQIIVGNAGDSRCVLSRNNLAIDLFKDFKPKFPAERQRIEAAGHVVTFSERGNVHHIDDGIAKFVNVIRNTVTFILDGNNYDVWEQYTMVMAHIRFWFVSKGVSINLRPILGYDRFVHIVPFEGTLHLVLRYGPRSVNLIIGAREAWLYGAAGANTVVQFERKNGTPYIQHEYSISLNGDGRYSQVAKKGPGDIPIGIDALRTVCSVLSEADENTDLDEIEEQLGVAIAHIMEPLKFHKPYEIVSGAIFSGESTCFEEKDPTVRFLVKIWGKAGRQLGKYVFGHFCNEPQPLHLNENLNAGGIKSLEDIFENIFIMPQAFIPVQYLEKKKPSDISSMVNSTWQPVDLGRGDPNVIPLENLYRRIQEQREQNIRDNKFIQDRRKYFGDRLGGKPCSQAISFVKSGATSSVFSWKASLPLPVKGNHILNAVQIAKKYCRFFK